MTYLNYATLLHTVKYVQYLQPTQVFSRYFFIFLILNSSILLIGSKKAYSNNWIQRGPLFSSTELRI
jgi:hypothetical protein